MQIALKKRFVPESLSPTPEEAEDIRQLKQVLNRLGYYFPDEKTGITADIDDGLKDALYAFQRKNTIMFNDTVVGPGSTTERILNEELAKVNDRDLYVWRTVDDEKVRGEHKVRKGLRYSFDTPPDGENRGEDYNCRCWAELVVPPQHPWIDWVNERRMARDNISATKEKLASPMGLKTNPMIMGEKAPSDAIIPVYPLEMLLGGGVIAKGAARMAAPAIGKIARELSVKFRDIDWIKTTPNKQFQRKFKHAKDLGIQGNPNKKSIDAYKKALENHIKSPDTKVIKGTYHKEPVTYYYNSKTRVIIIRDKIGNFKSVWKLSEKQNYHILKSGKLGGSKR